MGNQIISNLFKWKLSFLTVYFFILAIWWFTIFQRQIVDTTENYLYGIAFGLLPIFGGIIGLHNSKKWGSFKSYLGKSIIFFSVGLITWGFGNLIYGYYNLFYNIEVPYPSIADFIYIISWPLWTLGLLNLMRVVGARFRMKMIFSKLVVVIIPLLIGVISYYLLFVIARDSYLSEGALKIFFDIAYPTGDMLVLTLSLIIYSLSINYLGGILKKPVLIIIIALILNYFADFSYAYTTTLGTFYVAGWIDFTYTFILYLLSFGIALLHPAFIERDSIKKR